MLAEEKKSDELTVGDICKVETEELEEKELSVKTEENPKKSRKPK